MRPEETTPPTDPQNESTSPLPRQQKIIAPISSEEAILEEAQSVDRAESRPSMPLPSVVEGSEESSVHEYDTSSSLITEPLKQARPTNAYSPMSATQSSTPDNSVGSKRTIWKWIVGGILLAGLAVYGYIAFLSPKVTTGSLVRESEQSTIYLRPRQWKAVDGSSGMAYGNMKGTSGKSTAAVSVRVDAQQYTEVDIQSMRSQFLGFINEGTAAQFFQGDGVACSTPIKMTKKEDTTNTDTLQGMYYMTASCVLTGGKDETEVRSRAIMGKDGRLRSISIIATKDIWEQSDEAFEKMLMSIDQTAS